MKPEYIDHNGQVVGIRANNGNYYILRDSKGNPIVFGEVPDALELFERRIIHPLTHGPKPFGKMNP